MGNGSRPDDAGRDRDRSGGPGARDEDLDRRKAGLEAALAARRSSRRIEGNGAQSGGMAGFGNALRLSSEFIAAIVVGAGLGWFIDRLAGTSPLGLIVFLLLGFCAGVLNVLRTAGLVADAGSRTGGPKGPPHAN
ncbi:MAG: AtpZ/AtpI family protein [Brucellaceae bacterium]|nr:AtpZ/AtpI family protein [Hyphomonas sp.]MCC0038236.1 AtpZ/AtpI family protein [Brucellaceae bacterium]